MNNKVSLLSANDVRTISKIQSSDKKDERCLFFRSYIINSLNSNFQLAIDTNKNTKSITTNFLLKDLVKEINSFDEIEWLLEVISYIKDEELPTLGFEVKLDNNILFKETFRGMDFPFYKISW